MKNLEVMYDKFIEKKELNSNELAGCGVGRYALKQLVQSGKLKRSSRGSYCLSLADREIVYPLVSVIDRVLHDDPVVVLEPLREKDASSVLEVVSPVSDIQVSSSEDITGKKRIVLRNINQLGEDTYSLIKNANRFYESGLYGASAFAYELFLPSMENVDGFIYERLGMSYQNLISMDSNYATKAIDYFTLAVLSGRDCSRELSWLRREFGYNGVKIRSESIDPAVKMYKK